MSDRDSTATPVRNKPAKPYPAFPLTAHSAGYWCKKIRGRIHYFGKWDDPDGALAKYMEQRDALHAGRDPRPDPEGVTVRDVCNAFLNAKKATADAGELSQRTFKGYKEACDEIVTAFRKNRLVSDLAPQDFAKLRDRLAAKYGPHRLGTTITCVRCCFKFAFDFGLTDRPPRYGPAFRKPSKKTMRLHKAKQGEKLFTAEEVRKMIEAAGVHLKAMILLGVNCGLGNGDVGHLPLTALDLEGGWLDFPRPKTGVMRRCPLWPETVQALQDSLARRPLPKDSDDAKLVFLTKRGLCWAKGTTASPLSVEMRKLLDRLGINGHRNFYTLRHVFRTVADEARDQPAADFIMGHAREDMASVYRERISDERLKAVADHVRQWLFGGVE